MKILFVCTHNRCRSILSEAITNSEGDGLIDAKSAGSQPVGEVHPLSIKYLQQSGYPTEGLQSQSWNEFEDFNPDVVITVCDSAAGEVCPLYLGQSVKVHWALVDPSKLEGTESEKAQAFTTCMQEIVQRVEVLKNIAKRSLKGDALKAALREGGAQ